jgi:hypothetical protein
MPDENRFAGLGDAIVGDESDDETGDESEPVEEPTDVDRESTDGDSTDQESTGGESVDDETTDEPSADDETAGEEGSTESTADHAEAGDAESTEEPSASAQSDAAETTTDADGAAAPADGPAFEFEDTTAKSIYVRPDTLSVMDDAEFEVESLLRREREIRDVTGREFHDALVRVAAAYPEEVVEKIVETREG